MTHVNAITDIFACAWDQAILYQHSFTYGIEVHEVNHIPVKVYSLSKTVADCFKFRNKIGLDVALEALRETRRDRRVAMDELWETGKVCRVSNVMRPYLEAII